MSPVASVDCSGELDRFIFGGPQLSYLFLPGPILLSRKGSTGWNDCVLLSQGLFELLQAEGIHPFKAVNPLLHPPLALLDVQPSSSQLVLLFLMHLFVLGEIEVGRKCLKKLAVGEDLSREVATFLRGERVCSYSVLQASCSSSMGLFRYIFPENIAFV